ncbi:MAG TPA: sulfite exporter TauE/SafE family protein [Burkholderiales bacterium]|nr:sulfite exporter TauE/SafE family protein [Burkholderiales bacterium]
MEPLAAAMFAAGLASGVHCVAMCGGIVGAFDFHRTIRIRNADQGAFWARRLWFNAGRISTYAAAGAVAGAVGGAAYAAAALPAQAVWQVAASLLLILIGLHLAGAGRRAGRLLGGLEALGAPLWRRVQPLAARLLGAPTPLRAFAAGLAWGWLPCAMVYAALLAAAAAGDPLRGAAAMAAFGAGTLPFLLAAGWLAGRLRAWRYTVAAAIAGFGVYGLAHAGALEGLRRGLLCL